MHHLPKPGMSVPHHLGAVNQTSTSGSSGNTLDAHAIDLLQRGSLGEAEAAFRTLLAHRASQSANSPGYAMCLNSLATVHMRQQRLAEACSELEQALQIRERAHAAAPSSRGEMELGMLKRNLGTAQGLHSRGATQGLPSMNSNVPSTSASAAPQNDHLHRLSQEELQVPAGPTNRCRAGDISSTDSSLVPLGGGSTAGCWHWRLNRGDGSAYPCCQGSRTRLDEPPWDPVPIE